MFLVVRFILERYLTVFIVLEATFIQKIQYYVIFAFFILNVQYLHEYEAVSTKTHKTVNIHVLNSS
jgi:hypothetical protein